MVKTDIDNGIAHTYSTLGLKIRQKDTKRVFKNAYEPVDGKRHEYEEVEA